MSTIAKLTVSEYDRMIESGVFENRRLELIKGELREMSPIGVPHGYAVDELAEWSITKAPLDRVRVRIQHSLELLELNTVPEPDIAWVERLNYSKTRPTVANVFLIVEVSHSSLAYDRGEKAALYAEVGISDYWIVNIRDRCVEVHRLPALAAFGDIRIYGEDESVSPLHFPAVSLPVKTLFGA